VLEAEVSAESESVRALKATVEYKDQITTLRMLLSRECDTTRERTDGLIMRWV